MMATWIVHLRLAEGLLALIPGLDEAQFAIGSVAPDSGIPDENWEVFDPQTEVLHFQMGHGEAREGTKRQCANLEFYRRHLVSLHRWCPSSQQFSFLLGYFFHLVTDNLWTVEVGIPTKTRFAAEFEADPKFIWQVKRDWYGLDFAFVRREHDSLFWRVFLPGAYEGDFLGFLPRAAVEARLTYIKAFYQRADDRIEQEYVRRPGLYLSEGEMDRFVTNGVTRLFRLFQYLRQEPDTAGSYSILELGSLGSL
jgi:hypothetical protein